MVVVDWREQIYYWTGELSYDNTNKRLKWRGSWLGSFVGKPEAEEFAWSNNEFEYVSGRIEESQVIINNQLRPPNAAFFHGYYMMDATGSGRHEKYYDKQFFVEFQDLNGNSDHGIGNSSRYFVIGMHYDLI